MLQLNYYSHTLQFILGRGKWISITGSKYDKQGYFTINEPYTSVQFIPDDPDSFTEEINFESVLSPYTLKLVCALANDADDPDKSFTDLDYDLLNEINYNSEFDCTSKDFIHVMYDFSKIEDGSHLIWTQDIAEFVLKHSDSYADIINNYGLLEANISTEKLFSNGLYSAAEYLYFNVTPGIIYRYIDTYKEVYNLD